MKKKIAIVFLTFNSEKTLLKSLINATKISKEIFIVDSYSNDKTIDICKKFKCKIFKRKFENYSNQRNWIINKLNRKYFWQLHIDADEILDTQCINAINKIIINEKLKEKVFLIRRKYYFLGKKIKYPGLNEWHLRLFQSFSVKCENRLYDQHFITKFKLSKILSGFIHENDRLNLNQWKKKHIKWAEFEAKEVLKKSNKINCFNKLSDPRHSTRKSKTFFYKMPLFLRSFFYFIYRYFFKLGFLDGKNGILFCFYHALWYRLLIDYKIYINKKKIN